MGYLAFFDVDTQHDFMDKDGALYVPGAEDIKENIKTLVDYARKNYIAIIGSVDCHEADDPEFDEFPPHCIKGTPGQEKIFTPRPDERYFCKNTIDIFSSIEAKKGIKDTAIFYAVFGVATDYCVKKAVLGMLDMGKQVFLVIDAIAGIDEKPAILEMTRAGALVVGVKMLQNTAERIIWNRF